MFREPLTKYTTNKLRSKLYLKPSGSKDTQGQNKLIIKKKKIHYIHNRMSRRAYVAWTKKKKTFITEKTLELFDKNAHLEMQICIEVEYT